MHDPRVTLYNSGIWSDELAPSLTNMIELVDTGLWSLATFHHQRSLSFFLMIVVFFKIVNTKCLYSLNMSLMYQEETWVGKVLWNFISGILMCKVSS